MLVHDARAVISTRKRSSTNQWVDETQAPCTRELSEFVSSNSFFLLPKKEKVPPLL